MGGCLEDLTGVARTNLTLSIKVSHQMTGLVLQWLMTTVHLRDIRNRILQSFRIQLDLTLSRRRHASRSMDYRRE